jgi:hypothetical protein
MIRAEVTMQSAMASPLKILCRQIATGLDIMGALKHHRLPTQCGICTQTIEDADDIVPCELRLVLDHSL